jgi:hypothetical protein
VKENEPRVSRTDQALLLCLVAVLGVELAGWAVTRRTDAELRARVAEGPPRERTWALHVLLNRGEPPSLERDEVAHLLGSDEPLLREMATTSDVWRLAGRSLQREHLASRAGAGEAIRGRYYLRWHGQPIRRAFLREYLRSLEAGSVEEE